MYSSIFFFAAMHWILEPEPPVPQVCVPIIDDLLASPEFLAAEHPSTWLRQKLIVNEDQIQQVPYTVYNKIKGTCFPSIKKC